MPLEHPVTVRVRDLRQKDKLVVDDQLQWIAWSDAVVNAAGRPVSCIVELPDKTYATRVWDDPDHELAVLRRI